MTAPNDLGSPLTESPLLNIYCDESCHLEHDGQELMALGALVVPSQQARQLSERIRAIKDTYGVPRTFEAKWTKVSPAKIDFYLALVDEFLGNDSLGFRALVAHDKARLRHAEFGQDHDTWYYKMYWELLCVLIHPPRRHRIYLDIKDTRGGTKTGHLRDVLASTFHDWQYQVVERIQIVRSDEIEALQLVDLLLGAVAYRSRGLNGSTAKLAIVKRLEERTHHRLDWSTPREEAKLNLFHWRPSREPHT
jgi:hypothetical protein